jgi:hypothetical protein
VAAALVPFCLVGIALVVASLIPLDPNARRTQELLPVHVRTPRDDTWKPQELHLALTGRPGEMRVDWALPVRLCSPARVDMCKPASCDALSQHAHQYTIYHHKNAIPMQFCQYGWATRNLTHIARAQSHTYSDGGFAGMLYSAVLTGLAAAFPDGEPVQRVFYRCGSKAWLSREYSFVRPPAPASSREVKARAAAAAATSAKGQRGMRLGRLT